MQKAQIIQEAAKTVAFSGVGVMPLVLGTGISTPTRALYVGTAGNLILTFLDGSSATFLNLASGVYPFSITKAATTGTTPAADLVAIF